MDPTASVSDRQPSNHKVAWVTKINCIFDILVNSMVFFLQRKERTSFSLVTLLEGACPSEI